MCTSRNTSVCYSDLTVGRIPEMYIVFAGEFGERMIDRCIFAPGLEHMCL